MAAYDKHMVNVEDLVAGLGPVKSYIDEVDSKYSGSFRSLNVDGNTVSFYTTNNHSGTSVASFSFPEEYFLQQTGTDIVDNFAFSTTTYPNTTDPNLDGKTVFVMAVKGQNTNEVKYCFVDMARVMRAITSTDGSMTISGMDISVKVSTVTGNLLELKSDGMFVGSDSTKADKVANATANNFAKLDSNGNIADSGVGVATTTQVVEAVNGVFYPSGGASSGT